jgi:hypothetical protein
VDAELFDDLEDVGLGVELLLGVSLEPVLALDVHAAAAAERRCEPLNQPSAPVAVLETLSLKNSFVQ